MNTTHWTDSQQALWQRLAAHAFERDDGSLDFLGKLAREQGWSRPQARAAIEEYRKFCLLAACAGHAVTPSEEVDQVWHQHLTYTQDYWQRFCPAVLGMSLHHEGTDGQRDTRQRHRNDYAETLASYQQFFGPPPEAFWPSSAARFAPASNYRWVDRRKHWVIPRPRLGNWRGGVAALLALIVAPSALAESINPLEWNGPAFLALYAGLLLVAIVAAKIWRTRLSDTGQEGSSIGLDAMQLAYLAGGEARATDAGVAELLREEALRWEGGTLIRGGRSAPTDVLRDLQSLLLLRLGGKKVPAATASRPFDALRKSLQARGLLLDSASEWRARLQPALLFAAVGAFGVMKVSIGMSRGRPVGVLMLLCLVTTVIGVAFIASRVARTRAGAEVLKQARLQHAAAIRAPRDNDLPIAVALIGTAAMAGTAYAGYHESRLASSSSGDTSSSSCSSSSDGGGSSCSSGCGGCGGGGGD